MGAINAYKSKKEDWIFQSSFGCGGRGMLTGFASSAFEPAQKKIGLGVANPILVAEEEGFEPPDLLQSTVFKTAALNRSAIPPA